MSSARPVIIIGAGGHARVVADALLCAGVPLMGFTDADRRLWGRTHFGVPVLGDDDILAGHSPASVNLANGLGMVDARGAALRRRIQEGLAARGWTFVPVRHPTAIISPRAELAADVQVLAGAVGQPGAWLGPGTLINTRAVVEHDVRLDGWTHVAPGAVICGDVHIGGGVVIGANAVVRQGIVLSENIVVGIGAAVVRHHSEANVLAGVPARPLDRKQ